MNPRDVADLYLRVSIDRADGFGIERQEADCRAWAQEHGLTVRKVHVDRGRTAFRSGRRSGFADALTAITAGVADVLVVWKLDRLSRRGIAEVERFLDDVESTGGRLVSVMDGIDTRSAPDREAVSLLASFARAESEAIGMRVGNAKSYLRISGRWPGGRPPYGLKVHPETKRLHPDPETAVYARLIVDEALEGTALVKIARLLNSHGVESPRGGQWNSSTIVQLLRSPALAGLMPQTERLEAEDGSPRYGSRVSPFVDPASLEPVCIGEGILSVDEREAILRQLDAKAAVFTARRNGAKGGVQMLTGLARCGRCGSRMSKAGSSYQCSAHRMGRDCEGVSARVESLDRYVEMTVRARLSALEPGSSLLEAVLERRARAEDPGLFAKRAALEAEIGELRLRQVDLEEARYLRGEFGGREGAARYTSLMDRLRERRTFLEDALARVPSPEKSASSVKDLRREIAAAPTVEIGRRLIELAIDRVTVHPGKVGVRFDGPARTSITWADDLVPASSK
jgi:site-specific DNA recombinase